MNLIRISSIAVFAFSPVAFAHGPGTYKLAENPKATLSIAFVENCPQQESSLPGMLRLFTFSDEAKAAPFEFYTGFFVETEANSIETYVEVNSRCQAIEDGQAIEAEGRLFGGFDLKKLN